MSDSDRPGKTVYRLAKSVTKTVKCQDNLSNPCRIKGSVRNQYVSLSIHGGDGWAHLTTEQVLNLMDFLIAATDEIDARRFANIEQQEEVEIMGED